MNGDPLPPTPPMWSEEEVERHTQRILAERAGQPAVRDHVEDPFLKMIKGAGKLWRKANNSDKKKPGDDKGGGTAEVKGGVVVAERPALALLPGGDNTPSKEEEGGVWEEAVGDRFLNASQTETIVEGQFSWSAPSKPDGDETESVSDEQNLSSTEGTEEDSTLESHTDTERESSLASTFGPTLTSQS
jgi:hypothetical protein